ncbi:MAG: cation:proton antiporter, partial [Actinomycetota bacterium]|nr:cation:proton antiporter [Actinomycetota bacterium]
ILPPLLYSAALNTSLVDFNANRRSILLLSVGLVVFTTCGVALVAHWLVPHLPWAASFAIGAVVAPPDAVAATAIGRRIGLPRRIVTILEGESLLNDATALVALRTATLATVALGTLAFDFVVAAGGGVLVGLTAAFVVGKVRRRLTDPLLDSGLSFITPFAAYVAAEGIHASGVIAVVVAGLLLGHKAPILQTAQSRIQDRMNWSSIAFLLEGGVFLLIGLQASTIVNNVAAGTLGTGRVVAACGTVLVAVIVLRMVWVFLSRFLLVRPGPDPETRRRVPWSYTTVLGWAGMRGVVTLAAAFVIPTNTPNRDLLLLIAFTVTAGTLFIQGLSLPWLARRLQVPSPDPAADALARATLLQQASRAAMGALAELKENDPYGVKGQIKERLERRNFAAWESVGSKDEETPAEAYARIRQDMIKTEREYVLGVRSTGNVPHEVVSQVLAMLDVEESMLEYSERERARVRAVTTSAHLEGGCEHLREVRPRVEPSSPGECADCLREGLAWVHLRMCVTCGNIGCCDSSIGRHASAHFRATDHPVMRSAEPGDDWRWCFVDSLTG